MDLVITGEVATGVVLSPDTLINFKTGRGKALSWHFQVTSPRKKDFLITGAKTSTPYLKSEYRLLDSKTESEQGHVFDLKITLSPDTPVGKFKGMVKVKTDIPDSCPGEAFFTGEVRGIVMYRPVHIKFTELEDGSFFPAHISISNRKGTPFKVTGLTLDTSSIQWKTTRLKKGRVHRVDLSWKGSRQERCKTAK